MKLTQILILLIAIPCYVSAQQDPLAPVQSSWETTDKNYELVYNNTDYCDYYIISSRFKELYIRPGKNTLLRVARDNNMNNPEFLPSSFRIYKGYFPEKLNPDFVYALPVRPGKATSYYINTRKSTRTYFFRVPQPDTVFAVRSGVVCMNHSMGLLAKDETIDSKRDVLVYHPDCTMSHYGMLSKTFVCPGENIKVGQAIGTASYTDVISLSFFYLDRNKFENGGPYGLPHTYYNPIFQTTEGNTRLTENKTYGCLLTDSVIMQDMTKGERKRYEKKKLKMLQKK